MSIGNGSKRSGARPVRIRATGLRFERGRLVVSLSDKREISVPLSWYPTLLAATPAQRARWTMLGAGQGFHWRQLDLDLSVAGLTSGLAEAIPRPPKLGKFLAVSPRQARRRSASSARAYRGKKQDEIELRAAVRRGDR